MWHVSARLHARAAASRRRFRRPGWPGLDRLEPRALLAAGPFGLNVDIGPYQSFVNWLQVPGSWGDVPGQSSAITLNASGDPQSDAVLLFDDRVNQPWNGPDPNAVPPNLGGTYHLAFNGQATVATEYPGFSTPFTVQNQAYNAATNTTTADLVVPAGTTAEFFAIEFSNTRATASSATNTGIADASLIRPGYAAGSTQLYTNEFLAALKPYSVLRYLGPDNANGQPFFNGNTLVTVDAPQVDRTGMPWEYLVALANQTGTDMWINVPQGATDAYVTALAGIIKNGGTVGGVAYPGLNSNLKVYLEYSNEVWGGIPTNEYYQEAAVQNGATNQPLSTFPGNADVYVNPDGTTTTDVNTAVGRRYLERTAEIGQLFQNVFGADPAHQKLRPVLGWQENNYAFYPPAMAWFEHFFGPASAAFYGMGNANYWGPTDYTSVNSIIGTLQQQETAYAIPNAVDFTTLATYFGLKNVSYEGGPSVGAAGTNSDGSTSAAGQNALAASRDPRMEQLVYQHYVDYYADGGDTANDFSGPFGTWSPQNEWDAAELAQYGNPTASPKYRGTVDVADAAPVAVTAGVHVAAGTPTSFDATTDSLGEGFSRPDTGQQGFWLLNVAAAGTYDLKVATNANGGTAPGQVEVFLNDHRVGGVINVPASSTVDLGDLALSSGLDTLSIVVVHGSFDPGQGNSFYYQFQPTTFTLAPAGPPPLAAAGFESPAVGTGTWSSFAYNPAGAGWTFNSGSGVAGNGSGFTSGNPNAPEGTQVGFLQGAGSTIGQSVANWPAGTYALTFDAAQRGNYQHGGQDFQVLIDGNAVGTFRPSGTSYTVYQTAPFAVAAGAHTITFKGLDTAGGDNTAFLDAIGIVSVPVPVGDPGFEAASAGAGGYKYNPAGSAWAFAGQSGVTGNNSGFTSGNPGAPEGAQAAFLQGTGSISQAVAGWAAGTYVIDFDAAQRGNFQHGGQDFRVLVDGVSVGTFTPAGTGYSRYATAAFTVAAGSHTVVFQGLDDAGGDNTAFLDQIFVMPA